MANGKQVPTLQWLWLATVTPSTISVSVNLVNFAIGGPKVAISQYEGTWPGYTFCYRPLPPPVAFGMPNLAVWMKQKIADGRLELRERCVVKLKNYYTSREDETYPHEWKGLHNFSQTATYAHYLHDVERNWVNRTCMIKYLAMLRILYRIFGVNHMTSCDCPARNLQPFVSTRVTTIIRGC